MTSDFIRPRLVLVTTAARRDAAAGAVAGALEGGDVASVILDPAGWEAEAFQEFAETVVPVIQQSGAAAIVADDTRCAGRSRADGIHLTGGDLAALSEAMERFSPKLIVGANGFETRHDALEAGERLPDYLFFGRFGGDVADEPHKKNLAMGEWWAEIVEVPCIVMAGRSIDSIADVFETGAEFVAMSSAVFAGSHGPAEMVARANTLIDRLCDGRAA